MLNIKTREEAVSLLTEAIENGYSYVYCASHIEVQFKLSPNGRRSLLDLMRSFDEKVDPDYKVFTRKATKVIETYKKFT